MSYNRLSVKDNVIWDTLITLQIKLYAVYVIRPVPHAQALTPIVAKLA
jgi:hypothetical protein